MLRNELSLAIDYLEASNDIKKMIRELKGKCDNVSQIDNIISEMEAKIRIVKIDRTNDKLPFYQIFLAYTYFLTANWAKAIHFAERAEAQFEKNNQKHNQAISLWILGHLYCYYEQLEHAKSIINEAIKIMDAQNEEIYRSGSYITPNNTYNYQDIIREINDGFSEQKIELLEQLSPKKDHPTTGYDFYSRVLALFKIPKNDNLQYIDDWKNILVAMKPSELAKNKVFITEISAKTIQIEDVIENALVQILLAHCQLLGFYQAGGQQIQHAEKLLRRARESFETDDVNYLIINCYLDLLCYNKDIEGTGRSYLENIHRLLEEVKSKYSHLGFKIFNEVKMLQTDIDEINFPFKFSGIVVQEYESSPKRGFRNLFSSTRTNASANNQLASKLSMPEIGNKPETIQSLDYSETESPSFEEVSKRTLDLAGTSLIVNRPGLSDRVIDKMIQKAINENASVIFALSPSGGQYENSKILYDTNNHIAFLPNQIYKTNNGTQIDNARTLEHIRGWLRERPRNEKKTPIIFIFDTLQKWIGELEIQVRYLIQEASSLNLSIWLHSPIFLIPSDLLPTIGNAVIIWPSKNEIKLLEENLPGLDVDLDTKKQLQGLFIYNERHGNKWTFEEFIP